ncbi:MAG: flagellar biosynthesis protein FlhF [Armatimonadetes bacterium]|nr:flagellar biosynthesis protein FlhF [Armatimonadota bacterium]
MPTSLSENKTRVLNIRTYRAATMTECLLLAKRELGPNAVILSQRKTRERGVLGLWGGKEVVEVTCGVSEDDAPPAPRAPEPAASQIQTLEERIAELSASVQGLVDSAQKKAFRPAPVLAAGGEKAEKREGGGRNGKAPREPYPTLLQQLLDAEIAAPLARQLIADLPSDLPTPDARTELRTLLSQRLRLAAPPDALLGVGKPRLLAFVGTTGVGKTTTLAKLAARHALTEGKSVGIVTLDTHRVAAAQQLQTLGQVLGVPVRVAHDGAEFRRHVAAYAAEGRDWVLVDTAGRSPNDMLPLGETAALFQGLGPLQKLLAMPATLSVRDMENVVARFQHLLQPDALILTKLDEATDNSCFGKLLTVQAKHGLPLAYVTTGQRVPDDIAIPDAHAIAARIVSTAVL